MTPWKTAGTSQSSSADHRSVRPETAPYCCSSHVRTSPPVSRHVRVQGEVQALKARLATEEEERKRVELLKDHWKVGAGTRPSQIAWRNCCGECWIVCRRSLLADTNPRLCPCPAARLLQVRCLSNTEPRIISPVITSTDKWHEVTWLLVHEPIRSVSHRLLRHASGIRQLARHRTSRSPGNRHG